MLKRFIKLLSVQSVSGAELRMALFIIDELRKITGVSYEIDASGNILATKEGAGEFYPCVCAHIDTVHEIEDSFVVRNNNGVLSAWNGKTQIGIGGDDKCGIFACLEILRTTSGKMKAVFFTQEESGCIGSSAIDLKWFKDVGYIIGIDRKGNCDLVTEYFCDHTVSEEWRAKTMSITRRFGYKETSGLMTDSLTLSTRGVGVSCINMSCGYYEPHTSHETIKWVDFKRSYDYTKALIGALGTKQYKHNHKRGRYYGASKYSNSYSIYGSPYKNRNNGALDWDDDDYGASIGEYEDDWNGWVYNAESTMWERRDDFDGYPDDYYDIRRWADSEGISVHTPSSWSLWQQYCDYCDEHMEWDSRISYLAFCDAWKHIYIPYKVEAANKRLRSLRETEKAKKTTLKMAEIVKNTQVHTGKNDLPKDYYRIIRWRVNNGYNSSIICKTEMWDKCLKDFDCREVGCAGFIRFSDFEKSWNLYNEVLEDVQKRTVIQDALNIATNPKQLT